MEAEYRFPKSARLLRRSDFLAVQKAGRVVHGRYFLVVVAPTPSTEDGIRGRIGITVSKRVGNAVVRNRIKRLVREYVRHNAWAARGLDAVVIAKRGSASLGGYREVAAELSSLGARLRAPGGNRKSKC